MNQILLRSSKATLARCSRSAAVLTARIDGVQSSLPGTVSGVNFSRRFNSNVGKNSANGENSPFKVDNFGGGDKDPFSVDKFGGGDKDPFNVGKESTSLDLSSLADGNAVDGLTAVAVEAAPKLNFFVEQIMNGVEMIHLSSGLPYWGAICVATVAIRVMMLPIAIKTIKSTARMAHMKPDMEFIIQRQKSDPNIHDPAVQKAYSTELMGMYKKHGVNPLSAIALPFIQFPVFIAFFWALHDMGLYYPGFATGGAFWFTDLSVADATYILPIFNAASFMLMIELGADGMKAGGQQAAQFQWIMRGLAVAMVPLTITMPQGLFVYWSCNNVLSLIQTIVLKNKSLKKILGIPEPPLIINAPVDAPVIFAQAMEKERALKNSIKADFMKEAAPPAPPAPPAGFTMPSREERKTPSEKEKEGK